MRKFVRVLLWLVSIAFLGQFIWYLLNCAKFPKSFTELGIMLETSGYQLAIYFFASSVISHVLFFPRRIIRTLIHVAIYVVIMVFYIKDGFAKDLVTSQAFIVNAYVINAVVLLCAIIAIGTRKKE